MKVGGAIELREVELEEAGLGAEQVGRQLLYRERLARARRSENGQRKRAAILGVAPIRDDQVADGVDPLDLLTIRGEVLPVLSPRDRTQRGVTPADDHLDGLSQHVLGARARAVLQQVRFMARLVLQTGVIQQVVGERRVERPGRLAPDLS